MKKLKIGDNVIVKQRFGEIVLGVVNKCHKDNFRQWYEVGTDYSGTASEYRSNLIYVPNIKRCVKGLFNKKIWTTKRKQKRKPCTK